MLLFFISQLLAEPIVDDSARVNKERLLYSADESTPFGRMQIALNAIENQADPNTLFALSISHPHIAIMAVSPYQKQLLQY